MPAEWQPGARSVLLGATLAEKLEVEPGELLSVSGVPFWVRGVITQSNELSQVDASGAVFFAHRGFSVNGWGRACTRSSSASRKALRRRRWPPWRRM